MHGKGTSSGHCSPRVVCANQNSAIHHFEMNSSLFFFYVTTVTGHFLVLDRLLESSSGFGFRAVCRLRLVGADDDNPEEEPPVEADEADEEATPLRPDVEEDEEG